MVPVFRLAIKIKRRPCPEHAAWFRSEAQSQLRRFAAATAYVHCALLGCLASGLPHRGVRSYGICNMRAPARQSLNGRATRLYSGMPVTGHRQCLQTGFPILYDQHHILRTREGFDNLRLGLACSGFVLLPACPGEHASPPQFRTCTCCEPPFGDGSGQKCIRYLFSLARFAVRRSIPLLPYH